MIAVDTNLLVYAHRRDSEWHAKASTLIRDLAEGRSAWAIPWPCLHEFYAIVTHPRIYKPATTPALALRQMDLWMASPTVVLLHEESGYWDHLRSVTERSLVTGGAVHDARIAALCAMHGVRTLYSADRDFSRFGGLRVVNPLVAVR